MSAAGSPAHSSVSTTAVAGGGGGVPVLQGGSSNGNAAFALEDFRVPPDLVPVQDPKDEALLVLKSDLMTALNKEVKSLDEDNWKFEGPRSRINLVSRPGKWPFVSKT